MKTPREKYENDPEYKYLVDHFEQLIERGHFTPSELREASIFAFTLHEMRRIHSVQVKDPELANALEILDRRFINKR